MYELKYTKTTYFLLPTLRLSLKDLKEKGFKNAYLSDVGSPINYENHLYLLFEDENLIRLQKRVNELKILDHYEYDYDVDDNKIVVVFRIPDEYHHLLPLFKSGKYSLFDMEYVIDNFPKFKYEEGRKIRNILYMIFIKDSFLKNYIEDALDVELASGDELCSPPDFNEEYLNSNVTEKLLL